MKLCKWLFHLVGTSYYLKSLQFNCCCSFNRCFFVSAKNSNFMTVEEKRFCLLPFMFPLSHNFPLIPLEREECVWIFIYVFACRGKCIYRCGELLCKVHLCFLSWFEGVASSFTNTCFLLRKAVKYLKATLPFSTKKFETLLCYWAESGVMQLSWFSSDCSLGRLKGLFYFSVWFLLLQSYCLLL